MLENSRFPFHFASRRAFVSIFVFRILTVRYFEFYSLFLNIVRIFLRYLCTERVESLGLIGTCAQSDMYTCIHAYIHTDRQTYVHGICVLSEQRVWDLLAPVHSLTCIHAYMHTYIQTDICTWYLCTERVGTLVLVGTCVNQTV